MILKAEFLGIYRTPLNLIKIKFKFPRSSLPPLFIFRSRSGPHADEYDIPFTRIENSAIPKIASLENNKKYTITIGIEGEEETDHRLNLLSIDDDTEQIRLFLENLNIQGVVPESLILSPEERQKLTNWKNNYDSILLEVDEEEKNRRLNQLYNYILPEIEDILQKSMQGMEDLEKINLNPYLSEETKVYAKNLQKEIEEGTSSDQDEKQKKGILRWLARFPSVKKESFVRNNHLELTERKHLFLEKMKDFIGKQSLKETFFRTLVQSQSQAVLPVFLFTGLPGTGKTQFAKKVADALEVPLIKINCSLLNSGKQIAGVPGNLVGSMPGLIYQAITNEKVINPVILLDEIEKIPNEGGRDLSEIFLPFFDRNENSTIEDKFLNAKFDFSKVLFICSSNDQKRIPQPLLSRMKVIEFKGYTKEEKLNILTNLTIPAKVQVIGDATARVNVCQKIKDELLKLDIPLINQVGGIRELEAWVEDAVFLETDISLSQQEKEVKYLELKKDLEANCQLSKEQQKNSSLEEKIKKNYEKLEELKKNLKEKLKKEKNKHVSLKTQAGLLETYNSEKKNEPSKKQEEINKNSSKEQKPSQNSFINYPRDSEQADSNADKKIDDKKNPFLKSEEEKLVSELREIREDRQRLQKQLELAQQQQLNFSKEIRELRENINQNKKEDKQTIWLIIIIFTVILGNLLIIFGLRKFLKKSKSN